MDALRLALQGLWTRRGVSLLLLVVAAAAVASSAAGPLYLRAGQESLLRDAVAAAPPAATGIEVSRAAGEVPGSLDRLRGTVERLTGDLPAYGPPIGGVERDVRALGPDGELLASTRLVYRDDACAHVALTAGRCPSEPGDVAISAEGARVADAQVGTSLDLSGTFGATSGELTVTVVGIWQVRDSSEAYWYGRDYFVALRGPSNGTAIDALLTPERTFSALPAGQAAAARTTTTTSTSVLVDRPVDASRVALSDVPLLRARLGALPGQLSRETEKTQLQSFLPFTLDTAERAGSALRRPVLLVTWQLLVLAWFVLYVVVAGATSARGLEVALAKLRGFPPTATVAFALLETVLVLLAAVPLGLLAGHVAVRLLARAALGPAIPVVLTSTTLLAAGAALAGALVACWPLPGCCASRC